MKKLYYIFILIILFSLNGGAQPPKKFYCTYGGNGYDYGYDVKQTLDNGYVITGSTSSFGLGNTDVYFLKLDSMGQKKFEKSFGGYNNDIGQSVTQLTDSSYVVLGYTNSFGIGGYDIYIFKTDKNGILLWEKTLGGEDWDFAYSLQSTNDGGFIIGGSTYSYGRGNADGYIVKLDGSGNIQWTKTYGGKYNDEFKSIIQTQDGGYALTGYTKSYNDTVNGDLWAFKVDAIGDSVWCKFYGGNKEDFATQIIENNIGDFFISGATESIGAGKLDAYALKINNNGDYLTSFIDGTPGFDETYTSVTISKRTSTNIVTFIEKEDFPGYDLQTKIIELNFDYLYISATDYGSTKADETYKVISTNDKGYAFIGYTYGYNSILTNCYFLKMDSTLYGVNAFSLVSVEENEKFNANLLIYPNPTSDELCVISENELIIKNIKLYNINGKEIDLTNRFIENSSNSLILNLKDISNGLYFLKYLNKTEKITIIH